MHYELIANLSHTQRNRLAHVDFRFNFISLVGRLSLADHFADASVVATHVSLHYCEVVPRNGEFDDRNRSYRNGKTHAPLTLGCTKFQKADS